MPPLTASRSLPFSEPNSSRNIIGKASAKKALNGLRRNSLFWYRTWRRSSGPVAGCSPTGGPREPEVDVLERRAGDGQRLQLRSACDGPAGEGVQVPGGGDAAQQDAVLVLPEPVPQLPRQVGELLRLVHVVGGEQDRLAEVAQALHQLPRAAPGRGIEAGGRLVEEEQVGVADDAEGEVQAALLAAGQRPGPRRPLVAETDHVDHLGGVARVRVVAAEQRDDLLDAQLAVDAGGLEHDADPFAEGPLAALRVEAEHLDLAGGAAPVALQDLHRGRLAGPVGAEQGEALALGHLEVDPGDRLDLPIGLAQPLDPDGRHRVPSSRLVLVRGTAQG